MNRFKKITAVTLSALLLGTSATPAFAAADSTEKEEVIYAMTDASGKVDDLEAVNVFTNGDITDYGDYSAVKMLNTNGDISQDGDKITISTDAEKVYYQGTMKTKTIPWNISIRYFLDGKEHSAQEIAGKSGALEIRFEVTKNDSFSGDIYDDYALQASFTLDTEKCKNITTDGATVANVGKNKQLTYTILPGKGIDTTIKTDVSDFEMSAVAINGVRLNLDIDVDDEELMSKVDEIISAVKSTNSGASELKDGTGKLADATSTLNSKVGDLNSGVGALASGAGELADGLSTLVSKNGQLTSAAYSAYEGLCTAASTALNSKLSDYGIDEVALTPSTYASVLMDLLGKLDADAVYQQAYDAALQQVTAQVEAQADTLYRSYINSQGNSIYMAYVTSQADTLYSQVAAQAIYEQLIESGYTEDQANAYLQSEEGKIAVAAAVSKMTDEQKAQILNAAVANLTDEQKQQILEAALASLSDEQKTQIREAYIQQMMASDEITSQINEAVAKVSEAAKQVSELKGQLDSYGAFYQGLLDYTSGVADAASGAKTLKVNMDTLVSNTETLKVSVGELNDAVAKLYDGTKELASGTAEFESKTSNMDEQITEEVDKLTSGLSNGDGGAVSFVSDKNENVDSLQFVIKTSAIEKAEAPAQEAETTAPLNFWQKLLALFGLA
ncbi:MAG: hypothetical protein Q3982_05570 [Phoenicibacter congonensis]|uniref:X-X-X-Leu-X-X-Gly heptad repeats n=1 Tax=Phoenicibacter congonensis TaxID=1944646 RepID=A0AA43U6A4_9ACTN|nr:hypothetical protein [Phoenicibacter congonensis]